MTKLSDTQLVVLSAACQRADRNLLPLPANLKGGAEQKVIASLLAKGLVEERAAAPADPVWRTHEDGGRVTLRATKAAFQALGIELETAGGAVDTTVPVGAAGEAHTAAQSVTGGQAAGAGPDGPALGGEPAGSPTPARVPHTRADSKQARLIAMLQQPEGASLDEIVAATGWQAHTVRGAIAGALKKKLGLTVTSDKIGGRGRVYRVAG